MIKAELTGADALVRKAEALVPKLEGVLSQSIGRLTLQLLRNVKADKLSGQVLNVRSGRLRRSINQRIEGNGTTTVTGYVGTNVVYARRFEYGFTGTVQVKAHLRTIKTAFGRSIAPVTVQVASYGMRVNTKERSFLRSALAEMEQEIKSEIRNAVTGAVQ